jgi:hypothetical protein
MTDHLRTVPCRSCGQYIAFLPTASGVGPCRLTRSPLPRATISLMPNGTYRTFQRAQMPRSSGSQGDEKR